MVQATQWQVDSTLLPNNPYQKIRYYPAWPGGMRAFGAHPVPLTIKPVGSPSGFMPSGGISGAGLGFSVPGIGSIFTFLAAAGGVMTGFWLARKNREG